MYDEGECHACGNRIYECTCVEIPQETAGELRDRLAKLEKERRRLCRHLFTPEEADEWEFDEPSFDVVDAIIEYVIREATEPPKEHQLQLIRAVHEGGKRYLNRVEWGVGEKVYHDAWLHENRERNGQGPIAESITGVRFMNQRDASMIADVIQWLGTNIGQCFVQNCQKRIDEIYETARVIEWGYDSKEHRKAVANGVLQKMAIGHAISSSRTTLEEGYQHAIHKLMLVAGRRAFDIIEDEPGRDNEVTDQEGSGGGELPG